MTRLSVLMPTYNNGPYLSQAIDSILSQSFTDYEFVIVDDCSTDDTSEILAGYKKIDARIHIIRNVVNLGRGGARNRALTLLPLGEFIAVMDGDDIALPERFTQQIDYLDSHPDVVVLGGQVKNVDNENHTTVEQTRLPLTHGSLAWSLIYSVPFCQPSVMMRTAAVVKAGTYNAESAVEDAEYWTRIIYSGRFANLPEVLLWYRMPSERLESRMKDWFHPLREVSQAFMQKLLNESIDQSLSYCVHKSFFYDPDFQMGNGETVRVISTLRKLFEEMLKKKLLCGEDLDEVSELLIRQINILVGYSSGED